MTAKGFWIEKMTVIFLTSLTLVPSLLFGILSIPVVQSLYYLATFFQETQMTLE